MQTKSTDVPARLTVGTRFKTILACARDELSAFWLFVMRPRRTPLQSATPTCGVNALGAFSRIILMLLFMIAFDLAVTTPIEFAMEHWFQLSSTLDMNSIKAVIGGLIIAPIIEELSWRAGLRSVKYGLFVAPVGTLLIISKDLLLGLGISVVIVVIAVAAAMMDEQRDRKCVAGFRFARGRRFILLYPLVFWVNAISFALAHAANFTSNDTLGIVPYFAVSSQLMSGIMLGYLRLRDRLRSAIALHFLLNLFAIGMGILAGEIRLW